MVFLFLNVRKRVYYLNGLLCKGVQVIINGNTPKKGARHPRLHPKPNHHGPLRHHRGFLHLNLNRLARRRRLVPASTRSFPPVPRHLNSALNDTTCRLIPHLVPRNVISPLWTISVRRGSNRVYQGKVHMLLRALVVHRPARCTNRGVCKTFRALLRRLFIRPGPLHHVVLMGPLSRGTSGAGRHRRDRRHLRRGNNSVLI